MATKTVIEIMRHLIQYTTARALEYKTYTGAYIVKDNKIIANAVTSISKDNNPLAHAEIKAIQNALEKQNGRLKGCELYTTQQPCPMCASAMAWSNVSKLYYGLISNHQWRNTKEMDDFFARNGIVSEGPILAKECKAIDEFLIKNGI